jgi:hypothetical protein
MRILAVVFVIALGAGSSGCTSPFFLNSYRNLIEAQIQAEDNIRMFCRNHCLAQQAWDRVRSTESDHNYSVDHGRGFRAGYADYLDAGGNGEPPAVPPFRYRLSPYQTPQGYQAIEDWYAGFRHGAAVAQGSGLREVIVLPLSAPPINAVERRATQQTGQQPPALPPGLGPAGPPPDGREPLPPPKLLKPADEDQQVRAGLPKESASPQGQEQLPEAPVPVPVDSSTEVALPAAPERSPLSPGRRAP